MTENRPTLEPVPDPDVALLLGDTWKRPMVVGWPAWPAERGEAPLTPSVSATTLLRLDDRWRVFSGLEGEEEEEEEEDVVDDGVREEEETALKGSGMDTWERGRR